LPLSIIETVSEAARLALPHVTRMVEEGFSANAIQGVLQGQGLGFKRSELLDIIRELTNNEEKRPYLASLRDDTFPNPARLGTPLTNTLRNFSFNVEVRGLNTETTEPVSLFVTVSSSSNMTKRAIKDIAMAIAEEGREGRYALFQANEALIQGGTFKGNLIKAA
jgi:hypothetical protein